MKILVYLESFEDTLEKSSTQAVTAALRLKEIKGAEAVDGILIDKDASSSLEAAKSLGLDTVHVKSGVEQYNSMGYAKQILAISNDYDIVLMANTNWGVELSGYVTVKDDRVAVTDIIAITDEGNFTRLIHQNDVITTVKAEGKLLLTVRTGSFDSIEGGDASSAVSELGGELQASNVKVKEISIQEQKRAPLPEADIIVSGGRGLNGKEAYEEHIEALADVLGASVGATRAIVDDGWVDVDLQVGQTGVDVSPSLYFAIGISGAIQHISGMKSSDVIVAINTDADAPIFKISDYGIVADAHEAVPLLIEKFKEVLGK